jgi:hypothetical protein
MLLERALRNIFGGAVKPLSLPFFFGLILVLAVQLSAFYGVLAHKDMEIGDTSNYLANALDLLTDEKLNVLWSPGYQLILAAAISLTSDLHFALIATRIFITLIVAMLTFILFARYLSVGLSVALVSVIAMNPTYFDSLYSVHLAGIMLPLVALVIASYVPNFTGILWSLTFVVLSTILFRNEHLLIVIVASLLLAIWLLRWRSKVQFTASKREVRYHLATALLLIAAVSSALIYFSEPRFLSDDFTDSLQRKHTLNVCQIYAYYLMEVGDTRVEDPWSGCEAVSLQDLGTATPGFLSSLIQAPEKMVPFVVFNLFNLYSGLELLLLGTFSTGYSPDYWAQRVAPLTFVLAIPLLMVVAIGLRGHVANFIREFIWTGTQKVKASKHIGFYLLSAGIILSSLVVALTQRPRPSYLYLLGILIFLGLGIGLKRLLASGIPIRQGLAWGLLVCLLATKILGLPLYTDQYVNLFTGPGQPFLIEHRTFVSELEGRGPSALHIDIEANHAPNLHCLLVRKRGDECIGTVGPEPSVSFRVLD